MAGPSMDDPLFSDPNLLESIGQNTADPAAITNAMSVTNDMAASELGYDQGQGALDTTPNPQTIGAKAASPIAALVAWLEGLLKKL